MFSCVPDISACVYSVMHTPVSCRVKVRQFMSSLFSTIIGSLLWHVERILSSPDKYLCHTWTAGYIPWKTSTCWRSSELRDNHSPLEEKKNCAGSPADRRGSCLQTPLQAVSTTVIFAVAFHLRQCKGILSFWGLNETGKTVVAKTPSLSTQNLAEQITSRATFN